MIWWTLKFVLPEMELLCDELERGKRIRKTNVTT